jgi:hypothetical protein
MIAETSKRALHATIAIHSVGAFKKPQSVWPIGLVMAGFYPGRSVAVE